MRFFRLVWWVLGVGVAATYAYDAVLYTGAWLKLNQLPDVGLGWIVLAFWGATIYTLERFLPKKKHD